jgi:cobalt-zinc-cadmium efflux system membrane fusion protein
VIATATVQATPDGDAILTARVPGTVTRILVRMGDTVRAGQTLALIESRDASQITADRATAMARVGLARRQLARERGCWRRAYRHVQTMRRRSQSRRSAGRCPSCE